MNRRGHKGRVDANHAQIMRDLRKAAIACWSTAPLGDGFPDILASPSWNRKVMVLLEVKVPGEKLNQAETDFASTWPGPVFTVTSSEEAIRVVVDAAAPPHQRVHTPVGPVMVKAADPVVDRPGELVRGRIE